jgi:hypothetical protein
VVRLFSARSRHLEPTDALAKRFMSVERHRCPPPLGSGTQGVAFKLSLLNFANGEPPLFWQPTQALK